MQTIIWILGIILGIIILFFFIGIFITTKISDIKTRKKFDDIYESSPIRNPKKSGKPDEFKSRDERKEIVTGKAASQEYINAKMREKDTIVKLEDNEKEQNNGMKIVDIAKPVGFWSRLIMSQKLGFLMAFRKQQNNKHGYFVNLINAQAKSQNKEKSRGM